MIFGTDVASIVLGGLAAGMVLFIVSVGLSVTMGLMGFVNLAHGGFAMIGGYVIVLAMRRFGLPFAPALALGFIVTAGVSVVFERLLYARLYRAAELDQVLFTIGLVFTMIASVTLLIGPQNQPLPLPPSLQGQIDLGFVHYRTYSLVLIAAGVLIMLALLFGFERTRLGAQIRAAVDNRRMAESLGINIGRLFTVTFAIGSGMAGLGGGLSAEFLGLDPQYPLKYLVLFLIVVAVGGLGRVTGVFYAALIIGMFDFVLKITLPQGGTVFIYALTILLLLWRPQGLFGESDMSVAASAPAPAPDLTPSGHPAALALLRRHRLRWFEPIPWLLLLAYYFLFPDYLGFGTDVVITILFALSLDLVLGYAGIVTLGHAAFFGTGAYAVGMLAKYDIWTEPITGLAIAAGAAALVGLASGLVLLRTAGLTLLMLALCTMGLLEEAANMGAQYTGGFDGLDNVPVPPLFGVFEFDPLIPQTQYLYALAVLFICFLFVRTLVYSPFGQSLTGIRENTLRMHAVGAPVRRRLVTCYTISAAVAGIAGALLAQTNAYVNLSVLGLDRAATVLIVLVLGGCGRLYGAFVGAAVYMALSHFLAKVHPTAWQLGLGLLLVLIALFARNGMLGLAEELVRHLRSRRTPP